MEYDPFRFSRPLEELGTRKRPVKAVGKPDRDEVGEDREGEGADTAESIAYKNQSLATTSDTYIPFGHGRHAW